MWGDWNRRSDSVNCHRLLPFRGLGALTPLPLVVPSFLTITLLLLLSLYRFLALFVVMIIEPLCQSLRAVKRFRVSSYHVPLNGGCQSPNESFNLLPL